MNDATPLPANGTDSGVDKIDALLLRARAVNEAAEPVHTYEDVVEITRTCELSHYFRSPELETLYTSEFSPLLRKVYGGAEAFLLQRLQWTKAEVEEARKTGLHFTRDIDPQYTRIRLNDWQYSIPREFEHWLVWTLLPLVDWTKASPFVQEHGLAGRISTDQREPIAGPGNHTERVCQEIEAFARAQWPESTEFFWLVNPVKLQSVPGLAHAHVFVRKSQ